MSENGAVTVVFTKGRITKGAIRYDSEGADGGPQTIYLRRATLQKEFPTSELADTVKIPLAHFIDGGLTSS